MKFHIKNILFQASFFLIKKMKLAYGDADFAIIHSPSMQKYGVYFREYYQDIFKYLKYSADGESVQDEQRLIHRIIAHYHVIEKGLSMPQPRIGFGEDIVSSLIQLLSVYKKNKFPLEEQQYLAAIQVLKEYVVFNRTNKKENLEIYKQIDLLVETTDLTDNNESVLRINREEYIACSKSNFNILATNRVSIRDFSPDSVPVDRIEEAIKIAIKTPSVCNRQSWSTIVILDKQKITDVLAIHNGNRGFGHLIQCLIVVKADIKCFLQAEERNQLFIDSGMFGMSLVYALQYEELGSVVLNWAATNQRDLQLRALLPLQDSEVVSMLIAVGKLNETFTVPRSQRKQLDSMVQFV